MDGEARNDRHRCGKGARVNGRASAALSRVLCRPTFWIPSTHEPAPAGSNTIVWWDDGSSELGAAARKRIQDAEAVYVSAASEWEFSIEAALSKIVLRRSVFDATMAAGFESLPIPFQHAQAVCALTPIHMDPFDRMLVAVAIVEGFAIVSSDPILAEYPISFIDARS